MQLIKDAEKRESFAILNRFRVNEQLNEINKDIWGGVGIVERGKAILGYYDRLSFKFEEAYYNTYWNGGEGGYQSSVPTGLTTGRTTELSVFVKNDGLDGKGEYFLDVCDNALREKDLDSPVTSPNAFGRINHKFNVNSRNAQGILEELLLRSCILRQLRFELPLQIKDRAYKEILENREFIKRLK